MKRIVHEDARADRRRWPPRFSAAATLPARALVEIDVNKGNVEPLPIAITDFLARRRLGAEIAGVVAADLKRSGLFAPIDKGAFIEKICNPDAAPRFEDWKVINAQALVTGRVTQEADGRLRAEFRLWDTFAGQQLAGEQFFANKANTGGASPTSSPTPSMSG